MLVCSLLDRCFLYLLRFFEATIFSFLPSQRLAEWEDEEKTKQHSDYYQSGTNY